MISVTKGQWFPLTLENIMYQGAAFDVRSATELSVMLVSALGQRKALSFEVSGYNELTCVQDGTVAAGKYYIELSCKGADGQSYRMRSPAPLLEISETTKTSDSTENPVKVVGDKWELTADVEMREASARTYMSLLEETRQATVQATASANAAAESATTAATVANSAADLAKISAANADASAGKADTAAQNADTATKEAKAASSRADSTASHAPYVDKDGYYYKWNPDTNSYDKTDVNLTGKPFSIARVFSSVAEMQGTAASEFSENDIIIINTNDVEQEDNAKVYIVKRGSDGSYSYSYLVDLSGFRGFTGKTPQLLVGNVQTLSPGSQSAVSISYSGTDGDGNPQYNINFAIPKGDTGDKLTFDDLTDADRGELSQYYGKKYKAVTAEPGSAITLNSTEYSKVTFPDAGGSYTIQLSTPKAEGMAVDYDGSIVTGSTAPTLSWSPNIRWIGQAVLQPSSRYEFSIRYAGGEYTGILV